MKQQQLKLPEPSTDPEPPPPPAKEQLPVVTHMQTPVVKLLTINGIGCCGNWFGNVFGNWFTLVGNCGKTPNYKIINNLFYYKFKLYRKCNCHRKWELHEGANLPGFTVPVVIPCLLETGMKIKINDIVIFWLLSYFLSLFNKHH